MSSCRNDLGCKARLFTEEEVGLPVARIVNDTKRFGPLFSFLVIFLSIFWFCVCAGMERMRFQGISWSPLGSLVLSYYLSVDENFRRSALV